MPPKWSGSPRVIYTLQRAFVAMEARKAQLLAEDDLLPSHYALLMNVRANPGAINAELARLLGVTPQNITGLVARMTDRGLLERRPHERHQHVMELHLTELGNRVLAAADAKVAALEAHVRTALGDGNADQLNAHLARLHAAVSDATPLPPA